MLPLDGSGPAFVAESGNASRRRPSIAQSAQRLARTAVPLPPSVRAWGRQGRGVKAAPCRSCLEFLVFKIHHGNPFFGTPASERLLCISDECGKHAGASWMSLPR